MIKDRAVMEAHLALLGWVPFDWCKGGAHNQSKNDIVVWVAYEADDTGDQFGWTRRDSFPVPADPAVVAQQWPKDDTVFWLLAKGLTEDERFK